MRSGRREGERCHGWPWIWSGDMVGRERWLRRWWRERWESMSSIYERGGGGLERRDGQIPSRHLPSRPRTRCGCPVGPCTRPRSKLGDATARLAPRRPHRVLRTTLRGLSPRLLLTRPPDRTLSFLNSSLAHPRPPPGALFAPSFPTRHPEYLTRLPCVAHNPGPVPVASLRSDRRRSLSVCC